MHLRKATVCQWALRWPIIYYGHIYYGHILLGDMHESPVRMGPWVVTAAAVEDGYLPCIHPFLLTLKALLKRTTPLQPHRPLAPTPLIAGPSTGRIAAGHLTALAALCVCLVKRRHHTTLQLWALCALPNPNKANPGCCAYMYGVNSKCLSQTKNPRGTPRRQIPQEGFFVVSGVLAGAEWGLPPRSPPMPYTSQSPPS